jgi:type IX secretion system PorP/SprF family membrane protein
MIVINIGHFRMKKTFRNLLTLASRRGLLVKGIVRLHSLTQNEHILKRTFTTALKVWGFAVLFLCGGYLHSQDIHFSQFYHAPMSLNPAMAGVHSGDYSFTANYRSQWQSAFVPYTTLFASADSKFFLKNQRNMFFGGGLTFYHDFAGDANLANTQVALSGSYTYSFDRENFVSVGVMLGGSQRSFNFGQLTWDNQYVDGSFDPTANTNENFQNTQIFFGSVGAGINYHGQKLRSRSKLDVGAGFMNLNRPDQSFMEGDAAPLPIRYTMYMIPTIEIAKRLDLFFAGSAQFQTSYVEAVAAGALRIHLSTKRTRELALQLGAGYRFNSFGDAIIPGIEIRYANLMAGFTYDINVSDFQAATNRNGGPELAIRYIITNVKPLDHYRICKLF